MKNNQVGLKQIKQVFIFLKKIKVVQKIKNDCSLKQMENPVGKTIVFLILCGQGEEGEGQEKHNRMELKKMIYLYQQIEKGEQMICDSREKRGKTTQNKGEKDSKNGVKRVF